MATIIDICGEGSATKNTGAKNQKFLGATVKYILTKEDFSVDRHDINTINEWRNFLQEKRIVVFYEVESLENSNQEAGYYESRINKVRTKDARKSKKFKHELGICSYAALKSYENSEYTRIIEITSEGYLVGVANSDNALKGQKISSFIVNLREEATAESIEITTAEVVYKDAMELMNNPFVVNAPAELIDLEGVFEVYLEKLNRSTTSLTVKASAGCCDVIVPQISQPGWKLTTTYGSDVSISAVSRSGNEFTFTIANTNLQTELLLSTDGVLNNSGFLFEASPQKM